VLFSVRASTVDLIIIISKNIEVIKRELVLIRLKHLCYYNIVRITYHPSTSRAFEIRALSRHYRIGTRPNILYIKSCINRGAYNSLAK
jgi:hypothetical protein